MESPQRFLATIFTDFSKYIIHFVTEIHNEFFSNIIKTLGIVYHT